MPSATKTAAQCGRAWSVTSCCAVPASCRATCSTISRACPAAWSDGWLATGDLGSVDEDGLLTIVGRTKEIINRGGEKIAPYDVEKALLGHPAVREAAAFAVPHPRLGENVGAAVVLHPGAKATSTELIDFVYDRLAPFQRPRHVHIVDSLPVGPTGKISRPQLSAAFADARQATQPPAAPLEILIAEIWQRLLNRTTSAWMTTSSRSAEIRCRRRRCCSRSRR